MEKIKKLIVPAAIIGAAYLIFHVVGIGCPIKFLTGISCPGCGMTRAVLSLLTLDFKAAFYYHPLFPLAFILIAVFIFHELGKIGRKTYDISIYIICTLFLGVWILRFFTDGSEIVVFSPENSIVFKILGYFTQ